MEKSSLLDQLFSPQDQQRLLEKIRQIESRSSGELRLHVSDKRVKDTLQAARKTFTALGMTRTRRRNGVLVFLSLPSRTFAIVGDEGIDRITGPGYWEKLRDTMSERFSAGGYTEGLLEILDRVEAVLAEHFPYEEGDIDELPDDISYALPRSKALPWLVAAGVVLTAALLYWVWRLFFSGWS
jgi:uncharacterized membrane protein YgcG